MQKLAVGFFIGFRKTESKEVWVVRLRGLDGKQKYKPLGEVSANYQFPQAVRDANEWRDKLHGKLPVKNGKTAAPPPWLVESRLDPQLATAAFATAFVDSFMPRLVHTKSLEEVEAAARAAFIEMMEPS